MSTQSDQHCTTGTLHQALCLGRAAQPPNHRAGEKHTDHIGRGKHEIDNRPQNGELQLDGERGGDIGELRQEGHEEDRRLRVENLDGDAFEKGAPA